MYENQNKVSDLVEQPEVYKEHNGSLTEQPICSKGSDLTVDVEIPSPKGAEISSLQSTEILVQKESKSSSEIKENQLKKSSNLKTQENLSTSQACSLPKWKNLMPPGKGKIVADMSSKIFNFKV